MTWPRFRDQYSALVMSPYSDAYQPINYVASESIEKDNPARRFGTYMLRWENMDLPWDEMFHSTWNMYDYHADHLGGFKIYAPDIGDKIKIGDHPWFEFYDVSPGDSVLDIDEAALQLNLSTNQGLRHFDFHVTEAPGSPTFIHATAKMPGAYGWYFISYSQINSPGGIPGDPVSWTFPNWVDHEPILNAIYAVPPVALVPFFVIWFGLYFEARVALVFAMCFFEILINVLQGVRNIDRGLLDAARALDVRGFALYRKVVIPAASPYSRAIQLRPSS